MPYISDENILFIHIPKTGGTSVEFFFDMTKISNFFSDKWDQEKTAFIQKYPVLTELGRVNFEPQHFTPEILSRLIPNYSTYFSFTFVRNPYTRILSEYFWEEEIVRKSKVHDFDKYTFHRWCENHLKELNSSHKIPQVEYIDTHVDFIGKYENMENDFNRLIGLLCKKSDTFLEYKNRRLDWKNKTTHNKDKLSQQLLTDTKKLIYYTYKEDFRVLKYDSQL